MNIKKISHGVKHFFLTMRALKNISFHPICYRISSIDPEEQTAILHVIHKSIFLTQTFSEIIFDPEIVEGLSCKEACWIGVYYGKALRAALDGKSHLKNIKKPAYLLQHRYGQYKITGENRDGTIDCLHVKTKKALTVHPVAIAKDELFMDHFDANQACYIGMLAGMSIERKRRSSIESKITVPYLRVVR